MKKISLRHRFRIKLFFEGAAIGIFTGVIISVLRFLLDQADIFRPIYFENLSSGADFFVTFCGIVFLAIFLSKAMTFDKQVGGSGVPQIKGILQDKTQMKNPLRLLVVKFTSTVLAIGAGMSLGRAGVSVQFGSCVGNFFSKIFQSHKEDAKILLAAGASAGLSAVFTAPLAGVIFCIEELHKNFDAETLIATVTASVSAAAVTKFGFGVRPIFETITAEPLTVPKILEVPTLEMLTMQTSASLKIFLCFLLMSILLGMVGAFFTKSLLWSLGFFERLKLKLFYKILIPLILIIPLGKFFPEILGCGNVLVDDLLNENFFLQTVLILFAGKFLYTLICFGTNVPGGVFLPLLTLGALGGNIFASAGVNLNLFSAELTSLFIIFGMAAMFAAVVKSPVTGSILIMELTGQFSYLLSLIIISEAAFMTSDLLGGKPIFSALLKRKK